MNEAHTITNNLPWIVWAGLAVGGFIVLFLVTRKSRRSLDQFRKIGNWAVWSAYCGLLLFVFPGVRDYLESEFEHLSWLYDVAVIFFPLLFAFGVTYLTIFHSSGSWYRVFIRFQDLGIIDGDPNRQGREVSQTEFWLKEISEAKETVILSGVTLAGWFVTAWESFPRHLLDSLRNGVKYEVYLAHPEKEGFRLRARDKGEIEEPRDAANKRVLDVLGHIEYLFKAEDFSEHINHGNLKFLLYDGTPLSLVIIDKSIYFTSYLPFIPDRHCPQLVISRSGEFATQINNSLARLREDSGTERIEDIETVKSLIERIESEAQTAEPGT